jgi:hypothetical protein
MSTQARNVIEFRGDARQVADAVAIGVEVAAGVDLVDDGFAPPRILDVVHVRVRLLLNCREYTAAHSILQTFSDGVDQ